MSPRGYFDCVHFRGDRGSGWCRYDGHACRVYWRSGPCPLGPVLGSE